MSNTKLTELENGVLCGDCKKVIPPLKPRKYFHKNFKTLLEMHHAMEFDGYYFFIFPSGKIEVTYENTHVEYVTEKDGKLYPVNPGGYHYEVI